MEEDAKKEMEVPEKNANLKKKNTKKKNTKKI